MYYVIPEYIIIIIYTTIVLILISRGHKLHEKTTSSVAMTAPSVHDASQFISIDKTQDTR